MYIPRSFSKAVWDEALGTYVTLTRDAMTPTEDVELTFDGWVAGVALPPIPTDGQLTAQVEQVVETGDFAPTGAWDFTGATVTGVTADPPAGGGGGATSLDGLTDVDTSTTAPAQQQVLTYLDGLWKPATPNSIIWTRKVNTDPMSANTRWTSEAGAWSFGGTYGVQQTNGSAQDAWLRLTSGISATALHRIIRATVRATSGQIIGVGFGGNGPWNTGGLGIGLKFDTDQIWLDRYGSGGATTPFALDYDTDYELMVVEKAEREFHVYVNGVKVWSPITNADIVNEGVGLYCRSGVGWFRNVSVWEGNPPSQPFQLPTDL